MHDIDENVRKLNELRSMGVELAIDDFGTGYSSLAYLARLPVEVIKIDRTFIRNVTEDVESASIVQTIISLTQALNRRTVAEGVETEEQARLLRLLSATTTRDSCSQAGVHEEIGLLASSRSS